MGELGTAVVAVAGTLLGAVVAGWHQARMMRAQRQAALRDQGLRALSELAAALSAHRLAMWRREDLRLSGADPAVVAEAREASHLTRGAVTAPQVAVTVLLPGLRREVDRAIAATYDLRGAPSGAVLADLREAAVASCEALMGSAARELSRV